MSSPAAMVRIRDGRIEHLERGNTYDVVESVINGPEAIADYIDGNGQWVCHKEVTSRSSIDPNDNCGCLLIDYDSKVVLFYGGDLECSSVQQKAVMDQIVSAPYWGGWDVRWAYKGLLDAARYIDQVPQLLADSNFGKLDERGTVLVPDVTSDPERASSVIVQKRDGNQTFYPLDCMYPEDLLHYGEAGLIFALNRQGGYDNFRFDGCDLVCGFLFDEDTMTVIMWGLCCELAPEYLEQAWPGWKVVDLEGNQEGFNWIIGSKMG